MSKEIEYLRMQPTAPLSITLNDYIEAYYGAKILSFNPKYKEIITHISNQVVELNPKMPFQGRINEYGNHLEKTVVASIKKVCGKEIGAKTLGSGYPDICFKFDKRWFYIEVKIGPNLWGKPSSFRMFFTSTPKDIVAQRKDIQHGYHLLFHFEHNGPGELTGRYRITDLDGFKYHAHGRKQEGSSIDLYENHNKFVTERS